MPTDIKNLFFSDKLRTVITVALLGFILVAVIMSWAFPRQKVSPVDAETIRVLKEVSTQLQRAADNLEVQGEKTTALNTELKTQLAKMESNRDVNYQMLLQKYGMQAPSSIYNSEDNSAVGNIASVDSWLRTKDHHLGSQYLSPGSGTTGGDQQLQTPTTDSKESTDGSHPIPVGYKLDSPTK